MKIMRPQKLTDTFDLPFPLDKAYDLVSFGFNSVDHVCVVERYPGLDTKAEMLQFLKMPGGQAATTAIFAARMGLRSQYIGKVGGDDMGQLSLRSLQSETIEISNVIVEENSHNQVSIIIIDKSCGERTVLWQADIRLNFKEKELKKDAVCAGRIFHLDGFDPESALRAASWCREQGIPVVADLDKVVPNCRQLLKKVDFLIAGESFPREFTGIGDPIRSFEALESQFDGFSAVTLGARGAMARVGGRCVVFPGLEVSAVDTTGAGDIFHGAFIYGLLQNWPLQKMMAFANAAAGLSCKRLGARAGIRPPGEIERCADQLLRTSGSGGGSTAPV